MPDLNIAISNKKQYYLYKKFQILMKIAIIGAGLAGLATCYQLLSTKNSDIEVHVFDKQGIGKGASGIAAGLVHPYRRDYDRYIWNGKEAFHETLKLITV